MDGSAVPGASGYFSDGGHIHPTDTTRAPLASPNFTGSPTIQGNYIDSSVNTSTQKYTSYPVGMTVIAIVSNAGERAGRLCNTQAYVGLSPNNTAYNIGDYFYASTATLPDADIKMAGTWRFQGGSGLSGANYMLGYIVRRVA
jgi:hypothetical protein